MTSTSARTYVQSSCELHTPGTHALSQLSNPSPQQKRRVIRLLGPRTIGLAKDAPCELVLGVEIVRLQPAPPAVRQRRLQHLGMLHEGDKLMLHHLPVPALEVLALCLPMETHPVSCAVPAFRAKVRQTWTLRYDEDLS